jgi:hypothetical protein
MIRYFRRKMPPLPVMLSNIKWATIVPMARLIGRLRARRQIISAYPDGEILLGPKVVLFMHFDRYGNVRPQILHYIRELIANGRSVVFVTNAGKLTPAALAALREICAGIIIRKNLGYDFGAWRDAIEFLQLPRPGTEELILANDSLFGPIKPLSDLLAKIDYSEADIWGLTESWQYRYHLQSFFLAFGKTALASAAFTKFWDSVRPVPVKSFIVRAYEIGITQAMAKGGLRCAAIWPYQTLLVLVDRNEVEKLIPIEDDDFGKQDPVHITRKLHVLRLRDAVARRIPLNPSADLWRQLLLLGFPFIKRELLRDNPTRVEDLHDWIHVVRDIVGADAEPILNDLRMMLKNQAP